MAALSNGLLIIYILSLYNITEQEVAQLVIASAPLKTPAWEAKLVSVQPSVREVPSLIPHSIASLPQLLSSLCSFDKL